MKPAIEKKLQHVSPETGSTLRNPDTRMKLLFFSYNLWESYAVPVSEAKGEKLWRHKIHKDDSRKIKILHFC